MHGNSLYRAKLISELREKSSCSLKSAQRLGSGGADHGDSAVNRACYSALQAVAVKVLESGLKDHEIYAKSHKDRMPFSLGDNGWCFDNTALRKKSTLVLNPAQERVLADLHVARVEADYHGVSLPQSDVQDTIKDVKQLRREIGAKR